MRREKTPHPPRPSRSRLDSSRDKVLRFNPVFCEWPQGLPSGEMLVGLLAGLARLAFDLLPLFREWIGYQVAQVESKKPRELKPIFLPEKRFDIRGLTLFVHRRNYIKLHGHKAVNNRTKANNGTRSYI